MLQKIHIENFKSIHTLDIELGRINVFIGENGCGKSNILEALALASCAQENRLKNDDFAQKGIRVTRPDMMMNSFLGMKPKEDIQMQLMDDENNVLKVDLFPKLLEDITGEWVNRNKEFEDRFNEKNKEKLGALGFLGFFELLVNAAEKSSGKKRDGDIFDFEKALDKIFTKEEQKTLREIYSPTKIDFLIYELQTNPLRGFNKQSYEVPGRNGENLDLLLESFNEEEWEQLMAHSNFISWLDNDGILLDKDSNLDRKRLKLRSDSKLYFRDKFMQKKNNVFSVENANEGALHILFYLALFISKKTPTFFAIDNIENALNPYLCRVLMTNIAELAGQNDKQALITTHNPAVLDGLNLHDDNQRLFVVSRNKKGHTQVRRIELKPDVEIDGKRLKLSELWMRNQLGGIPQNF